MPDSAFCKAPDELPRFQSLAAEFCGEVSFHLPDTNTPTRNCPLPEPWATMATITNET